MPQNDKTFVSRGGLKLQAAIENFKLKIGDPEHSRRIENLVCLDVGSSTGGFVDCLLQNGAKKVYALDTAYGELAWKLRNDPRVVVMERTNILHLETLPSVILASPRVQNPSSVIPAEAGIYTNNYMDPDFRRDDDSKVDIVTIDAGWTKLGLILPIVKKFLKPDGFIIALLKPHYEADKKDLIKGVLPADKAEIVKDKVIKTINDLRFTINNCMDSPILGGAGNKEYLVLLKL